MVTSLFGGMDMGNVVVAFFSMLVRLMHFVLLLQIAINSGRSSTGIVVSPGSTQTLAFLGLQRQC
jgi:hypothetical protein